MHLFINEIHKILTSKQMFDFVYLVMMIIVVSIIKDMVVSLYKKRNEKRRLKELFRTSTKNNNQKKTVERFTTVEQPTDTSTLCNKLKYFLNDENFNKFKDYIVNHDKLFAVSESDCSDISSTGGGASCSGTTNLEKMTLMIDKLINTQSSYTTITGNTKLDALYDLIDDNILLTLKNKCEIEKDNFKLNNIHSIDVKHVPNTIQFWGDVKMEGNAIRFINRWTEGGTNNYEYTHLFTPTDIHFLCRSKEDAKIIKHGLSIEDRVRGSGDYTDSINKYGNARLPPLPSLLNDVVYIKTNIGNIDTCLSLENTDASDARDVRMEPCNHHERQKWIVSNNGQYKEIRHKQNPDLCLDYDGGTCSNDLTGTYSDTGCGAYEIRECNSDNNRLFEFKENADMIPDPSDLDRRPMIKTKIKPKRETTDKCIRYKYRPYTQRLVRGGVRNRVDIAFGKADCSTNDATEFTFYKAS